MANARRDASRIKTLRLALGPGASAITQLAAAVTGRSARRSGRMSVGGFFFPYLPGFPVLRIDQAEAFLLASGSAVSVPAGRVAAAVGEYVRVTPDGVRLLAIGRPCPPPDGGTGTLVVQPVRVFEPV